MTIDQTVLDLSSAARRDGASVQTKTITLVRAGRTVELVGVFHVATPEFWDYVSGRILARLAGGGEVHTEGVRDRPRRFADAYKKVATRMIRRHGLVEQGSALRPLFGRHMLVTDLDMGEIGAIWGPGRVRALRVITKLPVTLLALMPTDAAHSVLGSIATSGTAPGDESGLIKSFVLDMSAQRESRAITAIEAGAVDVTALWGAAHLPSMVVQLVELGWQVTGESWHDVLVLSNASSDLLEDVLADRRARSGSTTDDAPDTSGA